MSGEIFLWREVAAECGIHAKHGKEVGGDTAADHHTSEGTVLFTE